jgi:zinc protease
MAPAYRGVRERTAVALLGVLAVAASLAAQAPSRGPLPLAPSIRSGTLANGLTYFIRPNALPRNRAMLRLVVRAGSIDEADDQRGLAHMLEHMAFNGTTHFPPGQLVSYLESIGARFGPHVNAQTGFDETIYMLDVPTDRQGVLQRGIEALGDFAGGITLEPKEIDKERGVVLEEWRGNLGAGTRMQEPQIRAMFGASKYADRLPIGTPESIRSFPYKRLRDFYEANYRPERMAVIIVGDIKAPDVEQMIDASFGSIPRRRGGNRAEVRIPTHSETRFASLSDPEQTASSVSILIKRPFEALETAETYRRSVVRSLVYDMFNDRLGEIARRSDAPFLAAGSGVDHLGRTVEAATVSARVQEGRIPEGLSGLAQEVQRVRQFGFGDGELDRAKRGMLASYERSYNERDKTESGGLTDELVRHYLYKEAAPGIERELELVRQMLPQITAAEVNALAKVMFADANRVVLATSPKKEGLTLVSETTLRDALKAGTTATLTAWHDETVARELMGKKPEPGTVKARREIPEIGVTVLTLSNGVEVWLKPTDFRNDQISFTAYAPGGTTLASQEDYYNASYAASLVGLAGIGGFTPVDLNKLLAGKTAGASTSIGTFSQSVSGSATPKDLETALQLAYLRITAPNRDPEAFALMRRQLETLIANQEASPAFAFSERLNAINTMNHYTSRPLSLDEVKKLNPDRMMDFYRQRFANAADFTYFFVGAFKVDEIAPLLAAYIGALPSTGTATSKRGTLGLKFPASVVTETIKRGQEPKSQTVLTYFADTGIDEMEDHRLNAAMRVLQGRLRDILREQLGGTYSVSAGYNSTSPEPGYGVVSVEFGSSPENVEKLTKAVFDEVARLRRDGPTAADVNAVKEAEKNDIQTSLRQNSYWLGSLQAMHQLGRDPRRILQRMQRADSLTVDNIHAAFMKYFPDARHTLVTLMPATTAATQ